MIEIGLRQALVESVEEVLEKMFFVDAPQEADEPCPSGDRISAALTFTGDPSGWLSLDVTSAAALPIAADFLGEDEGDLACKQVEEVVCELANMICGSLLSRIESANAFRLGAPRLLSPPERATGAPAAEDSVVYAIDTGRGTLAVRLGTERQECKPDEKHES